MCEAERELEFVRQSEIPDLQARIDDLAALIEDADRGILILDEARREAVLIRDGARSEW